MWMDRGSSPSPVSGSRTTARPTASCWARSRSRPWGIPTEPWPLPIEAYQSWRLYPAPKRAEILFRVAEALRDRKPELTEMMTREMGKVLAEAGGDVQEGIDMTYYMAGEGRRMFGQTVPAEMPDKFAMSVRQPMGVVAVITPFNFPMAIPTWKLMPALVTGNTAVFKPAADTPLLGELLVADLRGGRPAARRDQHRPRQRRGRGRAVDHAPRREGGDVHRLEGDGHPRRHQGAATLKRIHLEMGGKNAIIVMDDADLDNAVDGILWSAFGTSGQRCTAASRVIVHERVYDGLAAQAGRARRGAADRKRPGSRDRRRPAHQPGGARQGAPLHRHRPRRGRRHPDRRRALDRDGENGLFYQPTIYGDVERDMRVATEEIFGPATALIRCRDLDEAIDDLQPGRVRPLERDLHRRRERRLPGDPRPGHRHHLHQRGHDRRRDPAAVRRHQVHRQRPPRGGHGRARHLHRVEVGVRRLLRQAAARPDRQPAVMRLTELHADLQTLRENLAAELQAINRYEAQAFTLADEAAKEVVQRIADDKKEHVARLLGPAPPPRREAARGE